MPQSGWLSLKVMEATGRAAAPRLQISVPKRLVRLATRRNRLKRLIREAWRLDPSSKSSGVVYAFRLENLPAGSLNLKQAQPAVNNSLLA